MKKVKTYTDKVSGEELEVEVSEAVSVGQCHTLVYLNKNYCYHRADGPAWVNFYENKQIRTINFFNNARFHNQNGPARIFLHSDGTERCTRDYFIQGKRVSDPLQIAVLESQLDLDALIENCKKDLQELLD